MPSSKVIGRQPSPKVIGEGSYGCVHNPPLQCKDRPKDTNLQNVSKLLSKRNADKEMEEYKLISNADTNNEVHIGTPISCEPKQTDSNKDAINKCNNFLGTNIDDYKLLLMKNGGIDLAAFTHKYANMPVTYNTREILEHFWLDMSRIMYGLKLLQEEGVVHKDLHLHNIVYNEDSGRANLIDFGFMVNQEDIITGAAEKTRMRWLYPPEVYFYDKPEYDLLKTMSDDEIHNMAMNILGNNFINKEKHSIIRDYLLLDGLDDDEIPLLDTLMNNYRQFMIDSKTTEHTKLLDASVNTFDTYGVGLVFWYVLNNTYKHLGENPDLINALKQMIIGMIDWNPYSRYTPNENLEIYEDMMGTYGLLEKYGLQFDDHLLVEIGAPKPKKTKYSGS